MGLKHWQVLAQDLTLLGKPVQGTETVSLRGAPGRILARPVIARNALPAWTHAVMDGYALGSVPPGQFHLLPPGPRHLKPGEAISIAAGEAVPPGTASVVLADKASVEGDRVVIRAAQGKDNIRRAGEESQAGMEILRSGLRLDARHAALAAAAGLDRLDVFHKPKVALLVLQDTGESLPHLAVLSALLSSDCLDLVEAVSVRTSALAGHLRHLAGRCALTVVVADSLGAEDGTLAATIRASGAEPTIHRAALKPAKPIVTGVIDGMTVLGLAGTAYATTVAAHLFLRPLLRSLVGLPNDDSPLPAVAGFSRQREPGRAEALPVMAAGREGGLLLTLAGRFGQLKALAAMDGFSLIDAHCADLEIGASVQYHPLLMPLV